MQVLGLYPAPGNQCPPPEYDAQEAFPCLPWGNGNQEVFLTFIAKCSEAQASLTRHWINSFSLCLYLWHVYIYTEICTESSSELSCICFSQRLGRVCLPSSGFSQIWVEFTSHIFVNWKIKLLWSLFDKLLLLVSWLIKFISKKWRHGSVYAHRLEPSFLLFLGI